MDLGLPAILADWFVWLLCCLIIALACVVLRCFIWLVILLLSCCDAVWFGFGVFVGFDVDLWMSCLCCWLAWFAVGCFVLVGLC